MFRQLFCSLVFVAALAAPGLRAQDRNQAAQSFTFRNGQAVYIIAYHTIEHFTVQSRRPAPSANLVDLHLPAEQRVKKEFEERRAYKMVSKAGEADFVFLVVIHHNAAEGMALSPEKYQLYRSKFDLEALREAAYDRWAVGPFKIHNLGKLSDRLVKKFHEAAQVSTKTN